MMDEIFDRTYQAGRADFNAGLDRGFRRVGEGIGSTIGKSLKVLHRFEWSAPWARDPKDVGNA